MDDSAYTRLIQDEDTKVLKPNGEPLLVFRRKVLSAKNCLAGYEALKDAAKITMTRGYAAGEIDELHRGNAVVEDNKLRWHPILADGTVSKTNYTKPVESGIVGFYPRFARTPYCRMTAFNMKTPEKFLAALPLIREIDKVFAKEVPDRYAAQMKLIKKTSKDFAIPGTAFTTITVNRNFQTAVHLDKGDLKEGFGVLTALRAGKFKGCYLCFPRFRVAVDMQTCDLLLADVHEYHGNTPLIGIAGAYERISLVLYYRSGMDDCGTAEQELKRVKSRKRGESLHGRP